MYFADGGAYAPDATCMATPLQWTIVILLLLTSFCVTWYGCAAVSYLCVLLDPCSLIFLSCYYSAIYRFDMFTKQFSDAGSIAKLDSRDDSVCMKMSFKRSATM